MNHKRFTVLIVLMILLVTSPLRALAINEPISVGVVSGQDATNSVSVTFKDIGYASSELSGPYDVTRRIFSMPVNWKLKPGGQIILDYDVVFSGLDASRLAERTAAYAGVLTATFNGKTIGYITLANYGSHTATLTIPADAVTSIRPSGQHELTLTLTALFDCLYDINTIVTIKETSRFDLSFDVVPPELDLARLPGPFFLRNLLVPDQTYLVVPDNPTAEELRAALNVMAGFGSMVGQSFNLQLISAGQMTEEGRASANLIFVGTPANLPELEQVALPMPVAGGAFLNLAPDASQDGIVALAPSPWNPNKVVMLVGGASGSGVSKAAQAVASGRMFLPERSDLTLVKDVQKMMEASPIVEKFSLQDLGYETETTSGIGIEQIDFQFFVAKEQVQTRQGIIRLAYYHSGLIDYGFSSISVFLNEQIIATRPFSPESEQITTLEIKIPYGVLRFGENRLTIQARMQPMFSCDFSGFSEPWMVVSNQTEIELPPAPSISSPFSESLDLRYYPRLLLTQSDLGDVTFVLARNDPTGWQTAANIAYDLGKNGNPPIPYLNAAYADSVPQDLRTQSSLILIGKARDLPILQEFNQNLPAPFDLDTNTATETGMQVVYRLPEGVSVGYLELMASPYNPQKPLLILSGNSDTGLAMAGQALLNDQLSDQRHGVFIVTNGSQIVSAKKVAHFSIVGTAVPGAETYIATPIPLPTTTAPRRLAPPAWLPPVIGVSGLLLLGILGYVILGSIRRNQTPKLDLGEPGNQKE